MTIIAKNIKLLREYYAETQEDLALEIGCEKTAISNYETGRRFPDNDILEKIATHYRVSVDELVKVELHIIGRLPFSSVNFKELEIMINTVLPIVVSDEAKNNGKFNEAYEMHKKLWSATSGEIDIESVYKTYLYCYEHNHIEEGLCNALSLLFATEIGSLVPNNKNFKPGVLMKDFLKDYFLRSFDNQVNTDVDDSLAAEFMEHIKLLQNTKYSDLMYYFIALRYIYDLPVFLS